MKRVLLTSLLFVQMFHSGQEISTPVEAEKEKKTTIIDDLFASPQYSHTTITCKLEETHLAIEARILLDRARELEEQLFYEVCNDCCQEYCAACRLDMRPGYSILDSDYNTFGMCATCTHLHNDLVRKKCAVQRGILNRDIFNEIYWLCVGYERKIKSEGDEGYHLTDVEEFGYCADCRDIFQKRMSWIKQAISQYGAWD